VANLWDGRNLNTLVMNYLIIEGYKSAAVNFAQEANMSHQVDLDSIQERVDIRHAIHQVDIQTAIERINELHPEVRGIFPFNFKFLGSCFVYIYCDDHFQDSALRQLIELIRNCAQSPDSDISEALAFATTHLAPRAPGNSKFLQDP